jgi:uncharacterized protein
VGLIESGGSSPADVVRRQYLASAAGDLAALRDTLAPDVERTEMAGFALAGTYRTPEGVTTNVIEVLAREWDGWTARDATYLVDGEHVVVLARYTATHRVTGKARRSIDRRDRSRQPASAVALPIPSRHVPPGGSRQGHLIVRIVWLSESTM